MGSKEDFKNKIVGFLEGGTWSAPDGQELSLSRAEVEKLADDLIVRIADGKVVTEEKADEEETAVQAEADVKQEKRRGEGV